MSGPGGLGAVAAPPVQAWQGARPLGGSLLLLFSLSPTYLAISLGSYSVRGCFSSERVK